MGTDRMGVPPVARLGQFCAGGAPLVSGTFGEWSIDPAIRWSIDHSARGTLRVCRLVLPAPRIRGVRDGSVTPQRQVPAARPVPLALSQPQFGPRSRSNGTSQRETTLKRAQARASDRACAWLFRDGEPGQKWSPGSDSLTLGRMCRTGLPEGGYPPKPEP